MTKNAPEYYKEIASSASTSTLPLGFEFMYEQFTDMGPEFRLLQIHALSEVSFGSTNVQCTLSHWELDPDHPHHPEYTALSYTWSAAEETTTGEVDPPLCEILVNGNRLRVGGNLYDCLCELRRRIDVSEPKSMYIWIDAICIDQFNVHERSLQVGLMGHIYRNACRVVVWLGKVDASCLHIVQPIVVGVTQMVEDFKEEEGSTEFAVIQEVVLARYVTYYCGPAEFSYNQMFQCADLLWWEIRTAERVSFDSSTIESSTCIRNTFLVQDLYTEEGRYKFDDRVLLIGPGRPKSAWTFLANLLYSSRRHQATDSRDKVYALLGLIATKRQISARDTVSVNYAATTAEVYTLAVRGIILDTSWLGFLLLVEDNAKRSFGIGWQVLDPVLATMSDLTKTAPDGGVPSFVSDLLQITAIPLGTIIHTTGPIFALLNSPHALALLHNLVSVLPVTRGAALFALARCLLQGDKRSIATDLRQDQDLTASFLSHVLLQALDTYNYEGAETSQAQARAQLKSHLSTQLDRLFGTESLPYVTLLKRDLDAYLHSLVSTSPSTSIVTTTSLTHLSRLRRLAEPFSQIFAAHGLDRSVFVTQEGALGTGPSSLQEGDGLWLVAKAPCCLIFREVAETKVDVVGQERGESVVREVKSIWEGKDERRGDGIGDRAKREVQEQETREVDDEDKAKAAADEFLRTQPSHPVDGKRRRFLYVGWAYVNDLQSVVGGRSRAGMWERVDVE
ncbi:uncharacterized protein RSE6_06329 [Rhynchosporium secalis]|uniref:Heterokaryon incompatibility domain-containing protein n=1 Tax=Rhynchosporium secalis TaxID=38038 RepID=A0A1E1MA33_RHYSE|nr:uncharacterized protein RSE6_06329 [Rhynchosporium secalis]